MRAPTYMTHPEHGRMPVYMQWHIEDNLKHGWSIEKPAAASTPIGDADNALRRGPGRPRKNTDEAAD